MGCKTIVPISSKKFIFFKLAEKIPQYKIKLSKISKLKAQGRVCQYLVEETNSPTKATFQGAATSFLRQRYATTWKVGEDLCSSDRLFQQTLLKPVISLLWVMRALPYKFVPLKNTLITIQIVSIHKIRLATAESFPCHCHCPNNIETTPNY